MMSDPREDADMLIVRTREAHEALQNIKDTLKEVRSAITVAEKVKVEMYAAAAVVVDQAIEETISTGLDNYVSSILKAIEDAENSVRERFEVLFTELLTDLNGQMERALEGRQPSPGVFAMQQIQETIRKKIREADF